MSLSKKKLSAVNIIMIMVALAIIATAAVPGYVGSHSSNDNKRPIEGIADVLGSAATINFAVRNISINHGVPITNCSDVVKALEGSLDTKYTIVSAPIKAGAKAKCIVTDESGNKATFVAQGTS